jgi:hypothetical protein
MAALSGVVLYLAAHLLLYLLVLRHTAAFARERVVFGYHAASFIALVGVVAVFRFTLPAAVAALGLHGIYSLSFLELWALADASYSLAILSRIQALRGADRAAEPPSVLVELGGEKRSQRATDLQRLGLVRRHESGLTLTPRGRVVAAALALVAWTAHVEREG